MSLEALRLWKGSPLKYCYGMDSGAHFYACDFQVHSPRDRNWTGPTPTDEASRHLYADRFIRACRERGLNAVAITDHHDVLFLQYIRAAALRETALDGSLIPSHDRLVVFPGVELTLALPCQALLLFDPEVTDSELKAALAILGIVPSPDADAKTCETQRLAVDMTLSRIYDALSNNASLKGRFILFPNVNDGGKDTILRTGFAPHYVDMPCVGGYVDGSVTGHSRLLILIGKDAQWGSRRIGVLQTSDNRREDFADLGKHKTWIKWSKPSAEALRQACLAPTSRISYAEPAMPQSWIRRMRVSASKYFGPIDVQFNPQTNMIIGGRGSGKSTLLEYLRWALCDQPVPTEDADGNEIPNYERRRGSLIRLTLQRSHGTVTVEYVIRGVVHTIRRDADSEKVYLSIDNAAEEEATPAIIQGIVRLQGYSQKQLSNVSVRNNELLRLVTSPLKSELDRLESEGQDCVSTLRSSFQSKESHRALSAQQRATTTGLNSKQSQLNTLQSEMSALAPEHKQAIDEHADFSKGQRIVEDVDGGFDKIVTDLQALADGFEKQQSSLRAVDSAQPYALLTAWREALQDAIDETRSSALELRDRASVAKTAAGATRDQAVIAIESHAARYAAATSQNSVIQSRLEEMKTASKEVASLSSILEDLNRRLSDLGDVDKTLRDARANWKRIGDDEFSLLSNQATALTAASKGELRVTVDKGKDVSQLVEELVTAIQGAQVFRDKVARLAEPLSTSTTPFDDWIAIVDELLSLIDAEESGTVVATPKLSAAGLGFAELKRIASRLSRSVAFELSLMRPATKPTFSYRAPDGSYIPFKDASPGQQANALLSLLFGQAVGPLLIDQPEDDLDNATALSIAESIWSAKEKRQLIIASHNPNLLVIGDAELVLHCSHFLPPKAGVQGGVSAQGGIDTKPIRDVVANVMEGGRDAFRLRMSRYGF